MKKHKYEAFIDLKPALSEEQLYDRITRDFALLANHAAQGALVKLLPSSMQPVMVARWGIDPATRANQITREQKTGTGTTDEALAGVYRRPGRFGPRSHHVGRRVGAGGGPKTMQSKKALGLYFCRRSAGCGRLYRRLQSANCILHGTEFCEIIWNDLSVCFAAAPSAAAPSGGRRQP